jgi:serine/threonine-protein kinase RsbW
VGLFKRLGKTSDNPLHKQFRLRVQTNLEALVEVLQWFDRTTQSLVSEKCRWACKLALAEGFTNTVRYAHQHLPKTTPIDVEVQIFKDYLEIRIWDWGLPFDLHAKLDDLRDRANDPLEKESDRGLFFMQELTDDLQYIRASEKRNCLVMKKKF